MVNETGLSVTSIWLVLNMDFQTVCDDSTTVLEVSVSVPNRPVKFQGRSVTLIDLVLESGKYVTDRP